MNLKEKLPQVKEKFLLKDYTTFKIGGRASYFFIAENQKEIISAVTVAKENNLPLFILGGGSNILISDKGFEGLVMKIESRDLRIENSNIFAEAGVLLSKVITVALENSLTTFEWAAGIPGTIGGAVFGNTGAFGESISDVVKEITAFDSMTGRIRILDKKKCRFGYRDSIFKKNKSLIILSVLFELKKGNKNKIKEKIREHLAYRRNTQPFFPSAGCIFKNPEQIPAGKLIEECDLKGKKIGNAQISKQHANFIVNLDGASAQDVKKLIIFIKKRVKEKFKIELKEEISYIGF